MCTFCSFSLFICSLPHCRKVRFDDEFRSQNQNQGGILNDDNWLNPDVRREQEYTQLVNYMFSFYSVAQFFFITQLQYIFM